MSIEQTNSNIGMVVNIEKKICNMLKVSAEERGQVFLRSGHLNDHRGPQYIKLWVHSSELKLAGSNGCKGNELAEFELWKENLILDFDHRQFLNQ